MPGAAFSPDGELLIAAYHGQGAGDGLVRIWHLGRRELLGSLSSRESTGIPPRWPPPAVQCASEGGIAVWDRDERRVVRRLPLDFTPNYLALDPEGRRLAVNNADPAAPRVVDPRARNRPRAGGLAVAGRQTVLWPGAPMGNCWPSAAMRVDPRVYVWNVRREALSSVLQGHTGDRAPIRALGLPAGDFRELGRYDPAVGRGLGGAPGDRAWSSLGRSHRMTAGWPSRRVGRSASGTWPPAPSAGRSTRRCSATATRGGTPPA